MVIFYFYLFSYITLHSPVRKNFPFCFLWVWPHGLLYYSVGYNPLWSLSGGLNCFILFKKMAVRPVYITMNNMIFFFPFFIIKKWKHFRISDNSVIQCVNPSPNLISFPYSLLSFPMNYFEASLRYVSSSPCTIWFYKYV